MRNPRRAEELLQRIERADGLDQPAELFASWLRRVIRPGPGEDVLSGTTVGHPLHPALVAVPIGAWATATVLDFTGGDEVAARRAVVLGTVAAVPAALTGANDWLTTAGPERRIGLVHAVANYAGVFLQVGSFAQRKRGRRNAAAVLSVAALSLVGVGGWLGGHLAYALGVGVDTTAFQKLPAQWCDVADESAVPVGAAIVADADGTPVLLARVDGSIVALADRCTHRGAPLHEGEVAAGCITCPWHGSTFDLSDGAVRSGPATRPQPQLEVEVSSGRVRVRRTEARTLRTNPVGR